MSDPTPPVTAPTPMAVDQATTDSWNNWNSAIDNTNSGLDAFGQMNEKAGSLLTLLTSKIQSTGVSLSNIGNLLSEDSAKFGAVTTAMIGATEAFKGFANVDTARINTFSAQAKSLMDILSNPGTAAGTAKKIAQDLSDTLARAGRPVSEIQAALKGGVGALVSYAQNVLASADNTLLLQNSFIQLTAAGGGMEDLFHGIDGVIQGVGANFEHLNEVTDKYQKVMYDAMKATNTQDLNTMYDYISQINKLPDGFKAVMSSMDLAGGKTSVLTAAIQYATGSGRNMADVTQDMAAAMTEYGVSADSGLRYTARVTEASEALHAQVSDVRDALKASADAFKSFVFGEADANKMTQNMSSSMEDYVSKLQSVGVPVQNAIGMFKTYTSAVQGMNQAQEAFLSATSGGPGGLMGGFQIDKMIQKGDMQGVQRKVEESLRRMTGPIVSLEEASKSQSAAAQYTRQIQIVQSGPLGGMAKTRGEAEALLESMRRGTKIGATDAKGAQSLEDSIKRGQNTEQLSLTKLSEIATNTQGLRMAAGTANLTALQRATAARSGAAGGVGGTGAGINEENQEALRAYQKSGGGATTGSLTQSIFKDLGTSIQGIPLGVSQAMSSYKEALAGGNQANIKDSADAMNKSMETWRAAMVKMPEDQKKSQMDLANKISMDVKKSSPGSQTSDTRSKPGEQDFTPLGDLPAGKQVGKAVQNNTTSRADTSDTNTAGHTNLNATGGIHNQPVPVVLASGSGITVNFTGKCPHCNWDIHQSSQATVTGAASQSGNKSS